MNKLSMRELGRWGRAGNQFFQYSFLRTYAKRFNLELQLPPWVGNQLFGATEPPIIERLKPWTEKGRGLKPPYPPQEGVLVNRDYRGYAQYHTSYFAPEKEWLTNLFQPASEILARIEPAGRQLRTSGSTVIGIHLRRGDYGQSIFPIIPVSWYLSWLDQNISNYPSPVLFIATEDPTLRAGFVKYFTQTAETLGINLQSQPMGDCTYLDYDLKHKDTRALDWYPDFYLLSQCDVILGPSSTFSFFAAILAPSLQEYWRASLAAESFERVDPWNGWPILREHVRDYPHLQGVSLQSNPYW